MELAGIVAATLLLVFAYQQTPREEKEKDVSSLSHEVRQSVVSTDNKGAPLERMEADRLGTTPRQIRLTLSLHPPKLLEDAAKLRALAAPPSAPGRAEPLERHELRQSAPQPMLSKESVPSVSATGARNEESLAPRGPTEVYGFIHGTVDSMGGAVLSVDYDKATNEPETIVLRIPAGSYSPLLERLGRAGQVKEIAEPRSAALSTADKSQMLEVHIDFIPSE
jgi:hypothetical protein